MEHYVRTGDLMHDEWNIFLHFTHLTEDSPILNTFEHAWQFSRYGIPGRMAWTCVTTYLSFATFGYTLLLRTLSS